MPSYPYMQFFTGDWLKDPAITLCSPATRGVWIDLLCAMHETGRSGELRGTTDQFARLARCSTADLAQALTELQATGAADVAERNGLVTLINRRMKREADARKSAAERQYRRRHVSEASSVTVMSHLGSTTHHGSGCGCGSGTTTDEGDCQGETPPPDVDLDAIGDWLERVPKVSPSRMLSDAITQHGYTLEILKDLWQKVTNTPKVRNRPPYFRAQIIAGAKP